jgi:DNA-binding NarL/FixJ family response regulator
MGGSPGTSAASPDASRHAEPIRTMIVDDHALFRRGLEMVLDGGPDIELVGQASDGTEAVEKAAESLPDVVLMDIRMPDLDGIEATRQITRATVASRVMILTTFDVDEYVYEALRAGACGFLLKDVAANQLAAGVRMVAAGDALLAPSITRRLIEEFAVSRPQAPAQVKELNPREMEIFLLVAKGMSNAEIAAKLVIGETTVKTHVTRLLMKLGVRDRIQAVVLAYEAGLVRPSQRSQ